jgi:hypothetical protein
MILARLSAAALLATAAAPAFAADVSYQLTNNSSLTLTYFYTSPVTDPNWSEDTLGSAVLAPGESGAVTIFGGTDACAYDIRFVFEGEQELVDQVNICEMASYTIENAQ